MKGRVKMPVVVINLQPGVRRVLEVCGITNLVTGVSLPDGSGRHGTFDDGAAGAFAALNALRGHDRLT